MRTMMTAMEPRQRSPLAEMGVDRYGASPKLLTKRRTSPRLDVDFSPSRRSPPRVNDEEQEEAKDTLPDGPSLRALQRKSPQRQESKNPRKKWTSAFRVVQSITRFKNAPLRGRKDSNASNSGFERSSPSSGSLANNSNESTPSRTEEPEIDPIYLALKQATGKYSSGTNSNHGSRRGSSAHNFGGIGSNNVGSSTPSPRNLSQVSLQDSGYAEAMGSRHQLNLGSTPHLDQIGGGVRVQTQSGGNNGAVHHNSGLAGGPSANRSNNNRRPKLSEKMKSLSLDCAEMPPPANSLAMRSSPYKSKPIRSARGFAASGESLDWERSTSPPAPTAPSIGGGRRLPTPAANGTHVVIHEYVTQNVETALFLGDRLHIVDNGDPDWLHGFKVNDRLEKLLTFPSTCVTAIQPGEQPMKLIQNCNLPESKFRLYRDQVVFAQPDSIREDGSVLVRNENRKFVYCPLQYLMLL